MNLRRITFSIILFLGPILLMAGVSAKYGKLSKEEVELKTCPFEPDADAIYLLNAGEIKITRSHVFIKKHIRIKILSEAGLKYADITLPYYSKNGYERILNIQAQTINVTPGNETNVYEVDKRNIFTSHVSGDWREKRFVFPNVRVGSIIEYEYKIVSDNFLYLNRWEFQKELPTLYSQLKVQLPEKLDYQVLLQGHRLLKKYRDVLTNYWELKDLPSIKGEPFLYNIHDYTETIQFQLAGYYMKNNISLPEEYQTLLTSWDDLAKNVMNSSDYRSYLNKTGFASAVLNEIGIVNLSQIEKMKKIYQYVQRNFTWNGKYRRFTYHKFNETITNKSGYSSEINLVLTLLLSESGLEACPMLISTRSHGEYVKEYPFLSQFNHLISYVLIDGKDFYLDATDPLRPYYLLSKESYVKEGFVLNKNDPHWQTIGNHPLSTATYNVNVNYFRPDSILVDLEMIYDGYEALENKQEILTKGINAFMHDEIRYKLINSKQKFYPKDWQRPSDSLRIVSNLICHTEIENGARINYYMDPVVIHLIDENPFKSNERYFPVQFPYRNKIVITLKLTFPDRYEIIGWPQSERIKLPNGYGEFSYTASKIDDFLYMQIVMKTNKTEIPPSQYENIKSYYSMIISKLSEAVVFSKK